MFNLFSIDYRLGHEVFFEIFIEIGGIYPLLEMFRMIIQDKSALRCNSKTCNIFYNEKRKWLRINQLFWAIYAIMVIESKLFNSHAHILIFNNGSL